MTLREFLLYQKGYEFRLARQWDMASAIMSVLANVHAGKGRSFQPSDFHPLMDVYSERDKQVSTAEERDALFAKLKKF